MPVQQVKWAEILFGKILVSPTDLPDMRFCVFEDPQEAKLSAITYTKKPE